MRARSARYRVAAALHQALAIDTGLLTDAVMDLERRGLLLGEPAATYLFGSAELYRWADGRPILRGIEHSHDVTRLSRGGAPFVAVNTAIEIDPFGQVNVEASAPRWSAESGGATPTIARQPG